jgi:hypothetical protein
MFEVYVRIATNFPSSIMTDEERRFAHHSFQ